jgi:hypothetical protein
VAKRGDHIPHPDTGKNMFLAYFNVFSRDEVLRLAKEIRKQLLYTIR